MVRGRTELETDHSSDISDLLAGWTGLEPATSDVTGTEGDSAHQSLIQTLQ